VKIAFFAFFTGFVFALLVVSALSGNVLGVVVDAFATLWNAALMMLALNETKALGAVHTLEGGL